MMCSFPCFHYLYHSASPVDFSPEQCWTLACCQTSLNGTADFGVHHPPDGETRKIQKDKKIHVLHPPWGKIQKNQRFAAPTALSHSAKIVGGALFRVCTSFSVSFGFETKAFAWLKLSGTPSVITSKGWSCCMKRWVKSTVSKHKQLQQAAISLHSITFAAVVYIDSTDSLGRCTVDW